MFFSSTKYPGLHMNKWGVVFADRDHPLANTEKAFMRGGKCYA